MSFYNQKWDYPYLTPSIAKSMIERSPLHAKAHCPFFGLDKPPATKAMNEGTIVDRLVFGQPLPDDLIVLDVADYKSKAAQTLRDQAIADGLAPIKRADYDRCVEAADMLKAQISSAGEIAAKALTPEAVIQKRYMWGDKPKCSTEPDIYLPGDKCVLDLKRTAVPPTPLKWQRHIASMNMHIQVAATMEATGANNFGWIVIESAPPHCAVIHWASPHLIDVGMRDWAECKNVWQECVETDIWPGYESGLIEPMPWMVDGDKEMIFDDDEQEEAA